MSTNPFRRTQHQGLINKYEKYGFPQNPFPIDPAVKPYSEDKRENGSIFLEELRAEELKEFQSRIVSSQTKIGFLMDYAAYKGRGIGKTAFMNFVRNAINRDLGESMSSGTEVLYAVYVSPSPEKRERNMSLIARNIYRSMLQSDLFMIVFARLRAFSNVIPEEVLCKVGEPDSYEATICNDEWLYNEKVDIDGLNSIVEKELSGLGVQITFEKRSFFGSNSYKTFKEYFSSFDTSDYTWKKDGCTMLFDTLVRILQGSDITHCIILLDEVEKIVTYQNFAEKRAFCDSLRNYFIDGSSINAITSYYKIFMTIHPNSQELLMPHWQAAGLERFSELGGNAAKDNTVFFRPIENTEDIAKKLTLIYMNEAESRRDMNSIAPFTDNALKAIMLKAQNVPGRFLKYMYNSIERGIENNWDVIDTPQVEIMWSSSGEVNQEISEQQSLPQTQTIL